MVSLFEHAAREAGDRFFGLRVGLEMEHSSYGNWTRYGSEADTLVQAIRRLQRTIWAQQTAGTMTLEVIGSHLIWSYLPPGAPSKMGRQHGDHIIPVLIRFVQSYLGPDWQPAIVGSVHGSDSGSNRPATVLFGDWVTRRRGVSIAIEKERIHTVRPRQVLSPLTTVDLEYEAMAARPDSDLGEINALVATRLLVGLADLGGLADFSRTSVRTIQRRLDRHGLTYRRVVDRIRYRKAVALLLETALPMTDIAFSLGYSDTAHFTRAFRRWAGRPPSAVRRRANAFAR